MKNDISNMNNTTNNNAYEKDLVLEAYIKHSEEGGFRLFKKDPDKYWDNVAARDEEINKLLSEYFANTNNVTNVNKSFNANISEFPKAFDFSLFNFDFKNIIKNGEFPNLEYRINAIISNDKVQQIFGAADGFCRRSGYTTKLAELGIVDTTYINAGNRSNDEKAAIKYSGEYTIIPNKEGAAIEPANAEIHAQLVMTFSRLSFIQVGGTDSELNENNPNYVNRVDGDIYLDFSNAKDKLDSLSIDRRTKIGVISYYPERDEDQNPKIWNNENKSKLKSISNFIKQGSTAQGAADMIKDALMSGIGGLFSKKNKCVQKEKIKVKFDLKNYHILNIKGTDDDDSNVKEKNDSLNIKIAEFRTDLLTNDFIDKCRSTLTTNNFILVDGMPILMNLPYKFMGLFFVTVKTKKNKKIKGIFDADDSYVIKNGDSTETLNKNYIQVENSVSYSNDNMILKHYLNSNISNCQYIYENTNSLSGNNDDTIYLSPYFIFSIKFIVNKNKNGYDIKEISNITREDGFDKIKSYLKQNIDIDLEKIECGWTNINVEEKNISGTINDIQEKIKNTIEKSIKSNVKSTYPLTYKRKVEDTDLNDQEDNDTKKEETDDKKQSKEKVKLTLRPSDEKSIEPTLPPGIESEDELTTPDNQKQEQFHKIS